MGTSSGLSHPSSTWTYACSNALFWSELLFTGKRNRQVLPWASGQVLAFAVSGDGYHSAPAWYGDGCIDCAHTLAPCCWVPA